MTQAKASPTRNKSGKSKLKTCCRAPAQKERLPELCPFLSHYNDDRTTILDGVISPHVDDRRSACETTIQTVARYASKIVFSERASLH